MVGLISINHNNAPLKVRERFTFTDSEIPDFYRFILTKIFLDGVFILSTCNRTEIYFEKENCDLDHIHITEKIIHALTEFKSFEENIKPYVYSEFDIDAVKHFFSVTSGLKSLVFGEYQIVSQIKEAYYIAQGNEMLGSILEKMIHKAFETGKNVRSQTSISRGATSVSSAAVEISIKKFVDPQKIKALVIGTGETGQLVIDSLKKKACKDITITNRTYNKAFDIAKKYNTKVIEFEKKYHEVEDLDMLVFSTGSTKTLLDFSDMQEIMSKRNNKPILIIDVGVPRNVDEKIEEIEGVELFNLDKLKTVVEQNNSNKKGQLKMANKIVNQRVDEFEDWIKTNQLKKTFALINESFNEINKAQLERYKENEAHSEIVKYGDSLSKKYSKMIIKQLRIAHKSGLNTETLNLVEELFDFNKN